MNPIHSGLNLKICDSPADAIKQGLVYRSPEFEGIEITQAVIVRNGTQGGHATVDVQLVDARGKKYVLMITAALLAMIVVAAGDKA